MARPKKRGRVRTRFELRLGNSERDLLVSRFIDMSPNAGEAIKALIANYMEGRVVDADGVLEILQQALESVPLSAAAPPQATGAAGKAGPLDPNDPRLMLIKNALPK